MECDRPGNSTRSRKILSEAKYGGDRCPKNVDAIKACHRVCDCTLILKSIFAYKIILKELD